MQISAVPYGVALRVFCLQRRRLRSSTSLLTLPPSVSPQRCGLTAVSKDTSAKISIAIVTLHETSNWLESRKTLHQHALYYHHNGSIARRLGSYSVNLAFITGSIAFTVGWQPSARVRPVS